MFIKILFNKPALVGMLVFVAAGIGLALASSPFDIEFPISELGNCADKNTCKTYCEESVNHLACVAFARQHGLGLHDESGAPPEDRFNKFLQAIEADGGPDGQCGQAADPIRACERVCGERANMKQCLDYAIKRGLLGEEELKDARKVLGALERGVKLPEACRDERTCREICENPKDAVAARQCFAFAKEAGLLPPEFDDSKTEKMFELIDKGEIRFAEMKRCEALGRGETIDDSLMEKCLELGRKLGFISEGEIDLARSVVKDGGPGACRGERACRAYCEDSEHGEECLAFAERHNLVRPEDRARLEEGSRHFQEGWGQMPEAVRSCVEQKIPEIREVLSGGRPFGPAIGLKMRQFMPECFKAGGLDVFHNGPSDDSFPGRGQDGFRENFEREGGGGFSTESVRGTAFPDGVKECFAELDLPFPPTSRPSADTELKLRTCMERRFAPSRRDGDLTAPPGRALPPEGIIQPPPPPSEGAPPSSPGPAPDQFPQQFQDQYREQYNQQYQQQFQQQYEQYQESFPSGSAPPPSAPPTGDTLIDPASRCAQSGGAWNGEANTCLFSLAPQPLLPSPSRRAARPSLFDLLGQILFGVRVSDN